MTTETGVLEQFFAAINMAHPIVGIEDQEGA